MLSLFKSNPTKKLEKRYSELLEQAMQAQRKGDIRTYSMLTAEAAEVHEQIKALDAQKSQ
jgi:hypothetical protein